MNGSVLCTVTDKILDKANSLKEKAKKVSEVIVQKCSYRGEENTLDQTI